MHNRSTNILLALTLLFLPNLTTLAQADITTGLVGWWKLDEANPQNNVAGAVDSSGQGNAGIWKGPPTVTNAIVGSNALSLNGSSQYIDMGTGNNFALSSFTLSIWANVSSSSGAWKGLFLRSTDQGGLRNGYGIRLGGAATNLQIWVGDGAISYIVSPAISTGRWVHVVETYDGVTLKAYINGVLKNSTGFAGTISHPATSLRVGFFTSDYFNGKVDDARIYNRALSAADVTELYRYGTRTVRGIKSIQGIKSIKFGK